jgi:hypothetical protein
MGLLRRPTPGEKVEGGRLSRPYGPGAHSRASKKSSLRLRYHHFDHPAGYPDDPMGSFSTVWIDEHPT